MNFPRTAVRALFFATATLFTTGAWAQPHPPQRDPRDYRYDNRRDDHLDRGRVVAPPGPPGRMVDDRAARLARERAEERQRLAAQWRWHGPPNEAFRKEMRTHADRIARLQRIKFIAEAENDRASAIKAAKLIERENARHDRWMRTNAPRGGDR